MIDRILSRFWQTKPTSVDTPQFPPKELFYPRTAEEAYFFSLKNWDKDYRTSFGKEIKFIAELSPNIGYGEWLEDLEIQNVGEKNHFRFNSETDWKEHFLGNYEMGVLSPNLYALFWNHLLPGNHRYHDPDILNPVIDILPSTPDKTRIFLSAGEDNRVYTFGGAAKDSLLLNRDRKFLTQFKQGIQDVAHKRNYYRYY